jgi:cation:H+ antiporter
LPELYFTVISSQKRQGWLILGNIMGSVITCAGLVLGIIALIHPITITDFSPYILGRLFMVLAAVFFMFFLRSGRKISEKEAVFLLGLYIVFLIGEVFIHTR